MKIFSERQDYQACPYVPIIIELPSREYSLLISTYTIVQRLAHSKEVQMMNLYKSFADFKMLHMTMHDVKAIGPPLSEHLCTSSLFKRCSDR